MSPSDSRLDLNQLKIHMRVKEVNLNKNENNDSTCKSGATWNKEKSSFYYAKVLKQITNSK